MKNILYLICLIRIFFIEFFSLETFSLESSLSESQEIYVFSNILIHLYLKQHVDIPLKHT